jgi:WD40 repeat protein
LSNTNYNCLYDEKFDNPISGLKFYNDDSNLFVAASEDGIIKIYDLRTNQKLCSLEGLILECRLHPCSLLNFNIFFCVDNTSGKRKTITSIDINQNNRVLCAGTDQIQDDAYLLFFDLRQRTLMGAYSDSHSDDITNVRRCLPIV